MVVLVIMIMAMVFMAVVMTIMASLDYTFGSATATVPINGIRGRILNSASPILGGDKLLSLRHDSRQARKLMHLHELFSHLLRHPIHLVCQSIHDQQSEISVSLVA